MEFSICETVTAITYHLRVVGDEGLNHGGGLGLPALCGMEVSWDTSIPFTAWNSMSRKCSKCHEKYMEMRNDD